jgi:hypothetical protein
MKYAAESDEGGTSGRLGRNGSQVGTSTVPYASGNLSVLRVSGHARATRIWPHCEAYSRDSGVN